MNKCQTEKACGCSHCQLRADAQVWGQKWFSPAVGRLVSASRCHPSRLSLLPPLAPMLLIHRLYVSVFPDLSSIHPSIHPLKVFVSPLGLVASTELNPECKSDAFSIAGVKIHVVHWTHFCSSSAVDNANNSLIYSSQCRRDVAVNEKWYQSARQCRLGITKVAMAF